MQKQTYDPKFKMIFAYSFEDKVFGNANKLPWSQFIKKDMEIFKQYTANTILVMGRATFNTLPCKLRNLPHFVITSETDINKIKNKKGDIPDYIGKDIEDVCIRAAAYSSVLYKTQNLEVDVCVIGGAGILKEAAKFVDDAMITAVHFRDKDKRYYDSPIYIDIDDIEKSLSENAFISLEDTQELKYTVPDGEIEKLIFTHYTNTK